MLSLIVKLPVVNTTVPDSFSICTLNVSEPSVNTSSVGVTENVPLLAVIVNSPVLTAKSSGRSSMRQRNTAPALTLVVLIVTVKALPSFMLLSPAP